MTSPFVKVYSFLNDDTVLSSMMESKRELKEVDENFIFTYKIPDEYQVLGRTPMIRMTQVSQLDVNWSDFEYTDYALHFAVEVFSKSIDEGNEISTYIVDKYKNDLNCIRTSFSLQYDDEKDVYNSFMIFKIIVNKGDI